MCAGGGGGLSCGVCELWPHQWHHIENLAAMRCCLLVVLLETTESNMVLVCDVGFYGPCDAVQFKRKLIRGND